MNPDTIEDLNPFYDDKVDKTVVNIPFYPVKNKYLYQENFIIIITNCLNKDIGVNWVTRVYNELSVSYLF